MKKILIVCAAFFCFSVEGLAEASKQQIIFEKNNAIFGFGVGMAEFRTVLDFLGVNTGFPRGSGGHELVKMCFKNNFDDVRLTLFTGYLHDYSLLYGFEFANLSDADKNLCAVNEKLGASISTGGGVSLGMSKASIRKLLGEPDKQVGEKLSWQFEYRIAYEKPKYNSWRAGPEGKKYTQHQTISGEFHDGDIVAEFQNDKLVKYRVIDSPESDFEIENVYDTDSPYAGSAITCLAHPYYMTISYDTTGQLEYYTLMSPDGNLYQQEPVGALKVLSIEWPDSGASPNNQITFSGELKEGDGGFSGDSRVNGGVLQVRGKEYKMVCNWNR